MAVQSVTSTTLSGKGRSRSLADAGPAIYTVEYLVIAGGGGTEDGFNFQGSGGAGAGGYLTGTIQLKPGQYTVTVGAGGARNSNGSNSVFGDIVTIGGGQGKWNSPGGTGGSGGGSGTQTYSNSPSTATAFQGYPGGSGSNPGGAGGGGGAGAVGVSRWSVSGAGNGGTGLSSSITGSVVTRAGGGGGAISGGPVGSGGAGGGGAGVSNGVGVAGTANTGGGGGGTSNSATVYNGSTGGSGIVILAYVDTFSNLTVGAGLTSSLSTVSRPGYKVYSFTAGTGTVTFS